jgi:RNA polymerase sigma-70 factor (ECF subfamily)
MTHEEQVMISTQEDDMARQVPFMNLQSFESLFRQYYQMLCSYAYRFVNDSDTAEEIVQDLFYKLWEKRASLQITTSVKSYLFSAVHNRCLKYIEHRNVETKYKNYYLQHESEIDNEPQHASDTRELQVIINRTLDSLPERCSRIFKLNRFEGLKYHEIASKLSVSIKTVEANMGKALKLLRKNLKEYVEIA